MADVIDAARAQAGVLEHLANMFDLLYAKVLQRHAIVRRCALAQFHHQQVAVLQQCVDIHRQCGRFS
ncbi:hypothetical protein D3C76_1678090 [compost metagenome]